MKIVNEANLIEHQVVKCVSVYKRAIPMLKIAGLYFNDGSPSRLISKILYIVYCVFVGLFLMTQLFLYSIVLCSYTKFDPSVITDIASVAIVFFRLTFYGNMFYYRKTFMNIFEQWESILRKRFTRQNVRPKQYIKHVTRLYYGTIVWIFAWLSPQLLYILYQLMKLLKNESVQNIYSWFTAVPDYCILPLSILSIIMDTITRFGMYCMLTQVALLTHILHMEYSAIMADLQENLDRHTTQKQAWSEQRPCLTIVNIRMYYIRVTRLLGLINKVIGLETAVGLVISTCGVVGMVYYQARVVNTLPDDVPVSVFSAVLILLISIVHEAGLIICGIKINTKACLFICFISIFSLYNFNSKHLNKLRILIIFPAKHIYVLMSYFTVTGT